MKGKLLILLLLLSGSTAFGQSDSLRFSVRGVVRDYDTGRPLSAVGVGIPGTQIAVITNSDGTFVIKSPTPAGQLNFSLLGYQNIRKDVPEDPGKVMSVKMRKLSFTLDPAVVMTADPASLMLMAIDRIDENLPPEAELFDCFYRETVQKRQRFIFVSEAVTKVYKSSSRELFVPDRAAVAKSRLLTSPRASDTLSVKVLGGPAMPVDLDIVKHRLDIFDPGGLSNYKLEAGMPEVINDRMQFVIKFSPATAPGYALHYGTVYIDRETLAFTRVELWLDVSDPVLATKAMLVRKPAGLKFKPKELSIVLNYGSDDGKMRLNYLKTKFKFNCDWKKKLFATEFTAVSEMVVTNRHAGDEARQIPYSDAFRTRDALADKTGLYLDKDYWAAYNIIEPTVSLEHAIARLKKD